MGFNQKELEKQQEKFDIVSHVKGTHLSFLVVLFLQATICEATVYELFDKCKVPVNMAEYYGAVLPGEGEAAFLLLEDLKNATTPTILPGVTGGMLREVIIW